MERLTAAQKREQRAEAIEQLKALCPPGTTVYTIVHTAAASGASRTMTAFVIELNQFDNKPRPYKINHLLWKIGAGTRTDDLTVRVQGGGMDMGFALVDTIARALYPQDAEARRSLKNEWL